MACAQEPQTRFTVIAGTDTGRPPWTAACRAGFILAPAWMTLPMATVPTSSGLSPARSMAAFDGGGTEIGGRDFLEASTEGPDRRSGQVGEDD
jgi:hypothetical protein